MRRRKRSTGNSGCKKVQYDELGAQLALARLKSKKGGHRLETRHYRCEVCKGNVWHLTSQQGKRDERETAERG